MSKDINSIDIKALPELGRRALKVLGRYRILIFTVFVLGIYGFVAFQAYSLSKPKVNDSEVQSEVTTLSPSIDENIVKSLQSLQDNHVSVQTLFDQARNNPFAE